MLATDNTISRQILEKGVWPSPYSGRRHHLTRINRWSDFISYLILLIRDMWLDVGIVSITAKPYILQKKFEPMNLLQMSCVITWAQKKFSLQPQKKKKKAIFLKKKNQIGISTSNFLIWEKKFSCQPQKCELELFMSNGSKVLIYLSFLLFHKEWIPRIGRS